MSDSGTPDSRWWRVRWIFTRRLCFGGLVGALILFCLSMTPSLVPRTWLFQGLLTGIAVVIGYGVGSAVSSLTRRAINSEPSMQTKRIAWWVLPASALVLGGVALFIGAEWQQDLRALMEMEQLAVFEWGGILVLALFVALLLLLVSRIIRGGTRAIIGQLDRFLPRRLTVFSGVAIATLLVAGFVQGVLFNGMVSAINSSYSLTDKDTSAWISQPTSELRSGGSGSLVEWESLGTKGRDFTGDGGGPSASDIEEFTGGVAADPIRVYVGLQSADSLEDRVALAVDELDRTGAFDRSVIAVMTTTGTGWIDENVADSLEFLHGGDTAEVGMQYSYLPSWVSFLVDRSKAADAGDALIAGVAGRIAEMPAEDRPSLLVFGESLGSFGTESAFNTAEEMLATVDGAMLVGPTFVNPLHGDLTSGRDEGSPYWRPVVSGGTSFRFAVEPSDISNPDLYPVESEWAEPRVVYLQNSSAPTTYFDPSVLYVKPEWLVGQRGPDVSEDMFWFPVVTFWQIAADLAFSMGVPAGHGHRYGSNVVVGWAEVLAPEGWTDADTEALVELTDLRAEERDKVKEAAG